MNDQKIEQEIQAKGLTALRVTSADIQANIASEHYFTAAQGVCGTMDEDSTAQSHPCPDELEWLTFCVLVLRNGFTVTGESACASPENFDAEIGRNIARANAVGKVWPLMGYALRSELAKPEPTEIDYQMALKQTPMKIIAEFCAEDEAMLGLIEAEKHSQHINNEPNAT